LDHRPGRGLEDDPVHGAAADGRPGPRARRPPQGRLHRRRDGLAAVLEDHRPADQTVDPRGRAVPHARRVPDLRQHLRPDRRRERDLQRLDRGLQQPDQGPEPRHRLDDVGADLRDDRDHRVHLRQVVRRSGTGLRRREAMTMSAAIATPKTKAIWWGVNILVLLYAFIPVIWIVSLSLKPDAVLNDGRFFPSQLTGEHYEAIFQNNDFTRALINSIGICLISTFIAIIVGTMAAYAVARLDFPGKKFVVGASLMIAMFPQIALVTPLFKILTGIGLF